MRPHGDHSLVHKVAGVFFADVMVKKKLFINDKCLILPP
jgi:hypothetical protein